MSVGEVNDEGVPLNTTVNTRLSRVCCLAARQRVSLILQVFDDLTENEKMNSLETLFKHTSISERVEAEGGEGSYEDHLSCMEEVQE
jgi:hypothetical protein